LRRGSNSQIMSGGGALGEAASSSPSARRNKRWNHY